MKALKTDNIYLRALEPEDVDTLFAWENDVNNWRVSGTKASFSRNVLSEFTKSTQDIFEHKQIRFMICSNLDSKAIGTIDLFDYDPINRSAGVGILIQDSVEKGKGYATETLRLIEKYSKEVLNLRNLFASMHLSNTISKKLFEKCEYQLIGTKKSNLFSGGEWEDELIYQLALEK